MNKNIIISIIAAGSMIAVSCNSGDIRRDPGKTYVPDMVYSQAYDAYTKGPVEGQPTSLKPVKGTIARGHALPTHLTQNDTSFNIAALNLIENMIQEKPKTRPRLAVGLSHPMFWTNEKILQFFMDVSDRIEPKTEEGSDVVERLERFGTRVTKNFISVIDDLLKADLKQRRSYKGDSIRDLLRALRNKKHHYHEIPLEVRQQVGEIPNGYTEYWTSKFPRVRVCLLSFNHCNFLAINACVQCNDMLCRGVGIRDILSYGSPFVL